MFTIAPKSSHHTAMDAANVLDPRHIILTHCVRQRPKGARGRAFTIIDCTGLHAFEILDRHCCSYPGWDFATSALVTARPRGSRRDYLSKWNFRVRHPRASSIIHQLIIVPRRRSRNCWIIQNVFPAGRNIQTGGINFTEKVWIWKTPWKDVTSIIHAFKSSVMKKWEGNPLKWGFLIAKLCPQHDISYFLSYLWLQYLVRKKASLRWSNC